MIIGSIVVLICGLNRSESEIPEMERIMEDEQLNILLEADDLKSKKTAGQLIKRYFREYKKQGYITEYYVNIDKCSVSYESPDGCRHILIYKRQTDVD